MSRKMSRAERKVAFLEKAEKMFEEMEEWYDVNEEATFEEIEEEARKKRREMMGSSLRIWVNGRTNGKTEGIRCEKCGEKMRYKGEVAKTVYGVEGDTTLDRAYYNCPNKCKGSAFFPSGQATEAAK